MRKYKERRNGPNFKRQRTALDDLASLERTKRNAQILKGNTDSEFEFSDVDNTVSKNIVDYSSDSSGQGTQFAQRTGIFEVDFPASAKVSKVDANHPKKSSKYKRVVKENEDFSNSELDTNASGSECDTNIQPSGIITKNSTNDSAEGTSTNEEDATINVNLARGRYSKKKGKIFFIHTLFIFGILKHDTTEESESDVGEGNMLRRTNAFGEPKTTRHNRPPRPKKLLEKREKIATHKSKCILQMHAAKKELDKVDTNI